MFSLRFLVAEHKAEESFTDELVGKYWVIMPSCLHSYHAGLVRYCVHFYSGLDSISGADFNRVFPSMQFHSRRRKIDHFQVASVEPAQNFHATTKLLNLFFCLAEIFGIFLMIMHAKKPRMLYEVGGMPADDFTNFRHVSEQDALMTARGVCKKNKKDRRSAVHAFATSNGFFSVMRGSLNQWKGCDHRKFLWVDALARVFV